MNNCTVDNIRTRNTPWYSWKNKSTLQKYSIISLLVLLLFAIFVSSLFFILHERVEICSTPVCHQTFNQLSKYIDRKANPCNDFYRFSCGTFLQNTHLDNRASRSVQDVMEDQIQSEVRGMLKETINAEDPGAFNAAKKFYKACMDNRTIERQGLRGVKKILLEMGGWPTYVGDEWTEEDFDWQQAVYRLRDMGVDYDFFFGMAPVRDPRNGTSYILSINDIFFNNPSNISTLVREKYLRYMVEVAHYFGARSSFVKEDSENVIKLLLNMAQISKESAARNNTMIYKIYNLQSIYRSVNWFQYILKLVRPSPNLVITDSDVLVTAPYYLEKLQKLLKDTPNRTMANFMAWHTIQHFINYLPSKLSDRAYQFLEEVNGPLPRPERWKTCIKATEGRMETVISTAYIRNFFDEKRKEGALEIIRNVKTQFRYNLRKQNWLDHKTKNIILESLLSSAEEIASYEDIKDALEEASNYEDVKVSETNLVDSALKLDLINMKIKWDKLGKPFNNNWLKNSSFVTGVNIYYSPKENILRFPIGVLRGVYYQPDRPRYVNYGALGAVAAHEISHVFIQAEHRDWPSDPPAELRSWWSPQSLINYDAKVRCLRDQYEKFEVGELGRHLNPTKTRDEDMADLAGMKVAYDAYLEWVRENGPEPRLTGLTDYSPYQLFWVSSAIHHCTKYSTRGMEKQIAQYQWSPQQYRVNGPVQNIKAFAHDFDCPDGSAMDPKVKCEVW